MNRYEAQPFILPPNIPSMAMYDALVEESDRKTIGPAFFQRRFNFDYVTSRAVAEDLLRRGILCEPDKGLLCWVTAKRPKSPSILPSTEESPRAPGP